MHILGIVALYAVVVGNARGTSRLDESRVPDDVGIPGDSVVVRKLAVDDTSQMHSGGKLLGTTRMVRRHTPGRVVPRPVQTNHVSPLHKKYDYTVVGLIVRAST